MNIDRIDKKIYAQSLCKNIDADQLNKYRIILRNHFIWLKRSQFLNIIEAAIDRKISIDEFCESYQNLYIVEVKDKIVEYENDLTSEAKQNFPKPQVRAFHYLPGAEVIGEFSEKDFQIYYDSCNSNKIDFQMSESKILTELVFKWLPLFRQYDDVKFEVQNKKFTISKFLNSPYSNCLFRNCEFEGVIFNNQIIIDCKFIDCVFQETVFCDVNICTSLFNNCQFFNVFWDIGPIVKYQFKECLFKENDSLSLTCENITFYRDAGWITISLDGTWDFDEFLNYISIKQTIVVESDID